VRDKEDIMSKELVPQEEIEQRIFIIRGQPACPVCRQAGGRQEGDAG